MLVHRIWRCLRKWEGRCRATFHGDRRDSSDHGDLGREWDVGISLAAAIVSQTGWAGPLEGEVKPSYHNLEFYLLEDHEEEDEEKPWGSFGSQEFG